MKKLLTLFSVLSLVLVLCFSLSACNVIKEEDTCTDHVDGDGNGLCDKCEGEMPPDEPTNTPDALGETDWRKLFELSNVTVTMTDSFYSHENYYNTTSVCRIIGSDVYVNRGDEWSVLGAQELVTLYRMMNFSTNFADFRYVTDELYKAGEISVSGADIGIAGASFTFKNVSVIIKGGKLDTIDYDWTQSYGGLTENGTMKISFSDYGTTEKPEIPECPHTDMDGNGYCDSCGTRLESTDPTIPGPGPSDPDVPAGIKVLAGQWKDSFKFDNATIYCVYVSNIGGVDKTEDALMYVLDSTVFYENGKYAFEIAEFIEYYMPFAEHFEKFTFDSVSCSYVGENLKMDISGAPVVIKEAYINFSSDANIRLVEYSFSFVDSDPKEIQKVTIAIMNYGTTVPPQDPGESPGDDPTTNPDNPGEPGTNDPGEHKCYDKNGDGYCDVCKTYIGTQDPDSHECYDKDGDGYCDHPDCGNYITPDAPHNCYDKDGDGICDDPGCGNHFIPVDPHNCYDNDGDGKCDDPGCGGNVSSGDPSSHECYDKDGDGYCDHYGCDNYVKPVKPDEPAEPEKPIDSWVAAFDYNNVTAIRESVYYYGNNYYHPYETYVLINGVMYQIKEDNTFTELPMQEFDTFIKMADFSAYNTYFYKSEDTIFRSHTDIVLEGLNLGFKNATFTLRDIELIIIDGKVESVRYNWIFEYNGEAVEGTTAIKFANRNNTQLPESGEHKCYDKDANGYCDKCGSYLGGTDEHECYDNDNDGYCDYPDCDNPVKTNEPTSPDNLPTDDAMWRDAFMNLSNASFILHSNYDIDGKFYSHVVNGRVVDGVIYVLHEDKWIALTEEKKGVISKLGDFTDKYDIFNVEGGALVAKRSIYEYESYDSISYKVTAENVMFKFNNPTTIVYIGYNATAVGNGITASGNLSIEFYNHGSTDRPDTPKPDEHECYDESGDGWCDYPNCPNAVAPDVPEYHICYDYTGDLKCDVCNRDLTSQPGSYVDEETWIAAFNAQNVSYTSNNNYVEDGVVKSDAVYYRIVNGKAYTSIDGSVWNEISFPVAVFSFAFSGDYSKFEYIGKTFYAEAINIYYPSEAGMPEGYYILAYDVKVYFDAAGRLESVAYGMKLMMDGTELDDASNEIYFYNYGTTVEPDGSGYPDIPDIPEPDKHEKHYDNDGDGVCDYPECGYVFAPESDEHEEHYDKDGNGYCDYPDCNLHLHFDNDCDGICDICEYHYYCFDNDYDGMCDVCGDHNRCIDYNGDGFCDYCNFHVSCFDNGSDGCCDFCGDHFECIDNDGDEYCDFCGADLKSYDDVYISEEEWMSAFYFENVSIDGVYNDLETESLFSATWRLVGGTAYYIADDAADWREDPNELEYVLAMLYYGKDFYSFNDYGDKYIAEDMTVVLFGQYIFLENVTVVITDGRVSTISFYVSQTSADDANSGWWEFSFYDYDSTKIPEGFDVPSYHACCDYNGDGICEECGGYIDAPSYHACFDKNGDGICEECGATVVPRPAVPEHEHFDNNDDGICDFDGCKVYVIIEFPLPNYEQKNYN